MLRSSTALLLFMCSLSAVAQNEISASSLFLKPGEPVPQECQQAAQLFAHLAAIYPHPKSGWHFVIVCDDNSWDAVMQKMGLVDGLTHYGETEIDRRITLFRGRKLIHPDTGVSPEFIVAHELAHIMLHSRNEQIVDLTARKWVENFRNPIVQSKGPSNY
ncbi:ImmA/IrrE family metallo-endopeptidase [Pseudacidobacterium ailaaui]|jgi:hypothetical protein|uniref:ImmA/IrrE family metallo-endopeptidase n=1 Tax=Pseudacidobacterium ailaaui TaxID=1382359 RepID=UPI000478DB6D|nr:hypothetical protein [Pseudacidobacterium ailaaui]